MLFEADRDVQLDRIGAAAMICAEIRNSYNDWEKRPEGWVASDLMPGAVIKTEEDRLREFAERVMAGDTFEDGAPSADELDRCRRQIEKTFKNVR